MRVLFDLRPAALVHSQNQKVDPARLTLVTLFVAFIIISLFNIGFIVTHTMAVTKELSTLRGEENSLSGQSDSYNMMVTDMRSYKEALTNEMGFLNQEIPVVEFLALLEGALPQGVKITNVEMGPGNVKMNGLALVDSGVVDFGERLARMDSIIKKVSAPITTKTAVGNSVRSNFTITCDIKGISEITDTSALSHSVSQQVQAGSAEPEVISAEKGAVNQ